VITFDREQAVSIGVLGVLLFVCAAAIGLSLHMRADAVQELEDSRDQLTHLQARAKAHRDVRARSGAAPEAFLLDAPTQGLAVAKLQAHLQKLADGGHCLLISSGLEPAKHEDGADQIRLQATLEANLQSLQSFLYRLEGGTPYVFIDSLTVQLTGAASQQRTIEDPMLRVTFGLRAIWRRGAA